MPVKIELKHFDVNDLGEGLIGINNPNYFCYTNACMQCLVSILPLRDYFISGEFRNHVKGKKGTTFLCNTFQDLAFQIWEKDCYNPILGNRIHSIAGLKFASHR